MRYFRSFSTAVSVLSAFGIVASLQAAQIGVKFVGRDTSGFNPAAIAGLVPQANWNTTAAGDPPWNVINLPLVDSNADPTTVTLTFAANDCWHTDGPTVTADDLLMKGIVKMSGVGNSANFVFKGLDPSHAFDVYTYINVNGGPGVFVDVGIGAVIYYANEPNAWGDHFMRSVNRNPSGPRDLGNYVLHAESVANASGELTVSAKYVSGGDGLGIAAMQLVDLGLLTDPPVLASVVANGQYGVKAVFVQGLDPATVVPGNFSVVGENAIPVTVTSATLLADGRTVLIGTTVLAPSIDEYDFYTFTASVGIKSKLGASPTGPLSLPFFAKDPAGISVNMVGGYDATHLATPLDPADVAGVVPLANWNNLQQTSIGVPLNDQNGTATPVTITFAANGSWYNDGNNGVIGGTPGDQKLIRGVFEATDTSRIVPFILNNVPEASYNLIAVTVLDDGKNGNPFNGELWWVNDDYANRLKVNAQWGGNFNGTWIRGVGQYNMECNYVQFDDVRPVNGTIRLDLQADTFRGRINGLQLIPVAPVAMAIVTQPADTNVLVAQPYQFTVEISGLRQPYSGQWFSNGVAVAGANTPTISGIASTSGDGAQFYFAVTNQVSFLVSSFATLTVRSVASPLSVGSQGNCHAIYLTYNLAMNLDGTYTVVCSNQVTAAVTAVTVGTPVYGSSQFQVVLPVSPDLLPDTNTYIVTVTGATAQNGMPILVPTEVAFVHGSDYPKFQTIYRVYDLPTSGIGNFGPAALQASPSYNTAGKYRQTINPTLFFDNANNMDWVADNYSGDLFGYFKVPTTGNYTFWMCSDDAGATYLATDGNPAHKTLIIDKPSWNGYRDWATAPKSAPIPLVADQMVYLEGSFSQGGGGQGYNGTYTIDSETAPVNGSSALPLSSFVERRLAPNNTVFDTLCDVFFRQPLGTQTGYSTLTVTFTAGVDGTPGWAPKVGYWYQWSSNGVPIVGATNASYTTTPLAVANSGDQYTCCASNNFSSACDTATVVISPSPVLLSASTLNQIDLITLVYTVPVQTNGTFVLTNSADEFPVDVSIVGYGSSSNIVILKSASPIAANTTSGLTVSDVTAVDGVSLIHPNPTFVSFTQGAAGRQCVDFATLPPNAVLYGVAALNADGSVHLTEALNDTVGTVVFTVGQPVSAFKVNYKLLMGDSVTGQADGTGFSFAPNIADGSFNEDGSGNGLTVVFNTYAGYFRGIRLRWNGTEFARQPLELAGTPAVWRDVSIQMTKDGYVTVNYAGTNVFNGIKSPIFTPLTGNAKFAFSGRCGGENEKNYIDDVCFNDYPLGEAVAVSITPVNPTVAECSTVAFNSTVTGSPDATYQWFRNGTPIPGAIGLGYTTPKLFCPSDNGAIYSLTVSLLLNHFSAASTVALTCDDVPPTLVAVGSVNGCKINALFSEAVDPATALDPANYRLNGQPAGTEISNIVFLPIQAGSAVTLNLSNCLTGTFTLGASGVLDACPGRSSTTSSTNGTVVLPELLSADVGVLTDPNPPGTNYSFAAGQIDITVGGSDFWGNSDHAHFVYTPRTGDFDVKTKVTRLDLQSSWSKAGLDARIDLTTGSPSISTYADPTNGANQVETRLRDTPNGGINDLNATLGVPRPSSMQTPWLRMQRAGDRIVTSVSSNGVNWQVNIDTGALLCGAMPPTMLVGVMTTPNNGNNGNTVTSQLDSFSLTPPGTYPIDGSRVSVTYSAGSVVIGAASSSCGQVLTLRLQGTIELKSDPTQTVWTDIPGTPPVTLPADGPMRYFRAVLAP